MCRAYHEGPYWEGGGTIQRIPENRKLPYPASVYYITYELILADIFQQGDTLPANSCYFNRVGERCRTKWIHMDRRKKGSFLFLGFPCS